MLKTSCCIPLRSLSIMENSVGKRLSTLAMPLIIFSLPWGYLPNITGSEHHFLNHVLYKPQKVAWDSERTVAMVFIKTFLTCPGPGTGYITYTYF